jgi:hypothetical protein
MKLEEIINSNKNLITVKIKPENIKNNDYQVIEINNLNQYYDINIDNNKFKIKFDNKNYNLFKNIFSKSLQRAIHLSVVNWMNRQIKNDIFRTTSNLLNQPGIAMNHLLYDYPTMFKEPMKCRILDTTDRVLLINDYKIHMNIKLKYLFWVIQKIIDNSSKFYLFSHFKIHLNFWNYKILNKKSPNIVFYSYKDENTEITKKCFRNLVKLLLELFPDKLNISSKKFSRFTFKLNNNIYLCIGDANDKINKSSKYTIPLEYQQIKNNNQYDKYKRIIKKLSYYDLYDENTNYLVKRNNNSINQIFNDIGLDKPIKLNYKLF